MIQTHFAFEVGLILLSVACGFCFGWIECDRKWKEANMELALMRKRWRRK